MSEAATQDFVRALLPCYIDAHAPPAALREAAAAPDAATAEAAVAPEAAVATTAFEEVARALNGVRRVDRLAAAATGEGAWLCGALRDLTHHLLLAAAKGYAPVCPLCLVTGDSEHC